MVSALSRLGSDLVVFSDLPPPIVRLWLVILDLIALIGKVAASFSFSGYFPKKAFDGS